jgi:hypothetical protein
MKNVYKMRGTYGGDIFSPRELNENMAQYRHWEEGANTEGVNYTLID